jgi:hypothetical protein
MPIRNVLSYAEEHLFTINHKNKLKEYWQVYQQNNKISKNISLENNLQSNKKIP